MLCSQQKTKYLHFTKNELHISFIEKYSRPAIAAAAFAGPALVHHESFQRSLFQTSPACTQLGALRRRVACLVAGDLAAAWQRIGFPAFSDAVALPAECHFAWPSLSAGAGLEYLD